MRNSEPLPGGINKAIERYNDIMWECGYEHKTIGTNLSDNTENWNLRDMVSEAAYLLSCYLESGNVRYEDRLLGEYEYKTWLREKGRLQRFIKRYEPYISDMECTEKHVSKYD